MTITRIDPNSRMSEAVIHGDTIYLAGQIGAPGADITTQTRAVLAEIDDLLARAGSDKTRIVMAQIFIADLADFAAMNEVWDEWVPAGNAPPRATVEAQLARPEWKIEIVVTAGL